MKKIQTVSLVLTTILLGPFILFTFAISIENLIFHDPSLASPYTNNRFPEIEKRCNPFLSSASELNPDASLGYKLMHELSFSNGDWEQEIGGAPLMIPYDDIDLSVSFSPLVSPLKLVSFEVKDVGPIEKSKKSLYLHGTMCTGMSKDSPLDCDLLSNFGMYPGMSALNIMFEGVYVENEEERVVCMLGNTTFPFWESVSDPSDMINGGSSLSKHEPHLVQDDKILLVLTYPKALNLTRRAIHGEMQSLNDQGSLKYFDLVHISSQLSRDSKYQFNPEERWSNSCDPNLNQDDLVQDGVLFNHSDFCMVLGNLGYHQTFKITPNWRFVGKQQYYRRLGPFLFGKAFKAPDWAYDNVKFIMQNLVCEQERTDGKSQNALVSAVLRAFPAPMGPDSATFRTGISDNTISVEGVWNSSTGLLCMTGCVGAVTRLEECNVRISLYFPQFFSSTRRSIIYGSISSDLDSSFPVLFEKETSSKGVLFNYGWYVRSYLSYNYSKTDLVCAFKKKSQLPRAFTLLIKKTLFIYPTIRCKNEAISHFDLLSHYLSIDAYANSYPSSSGNKPDIYVQINVLSLGSLFGYAPSLRRPNLSVNPQTEFNKSTVLNVSLYLQFSDATLPFVQKSYKNISGLFLEGVYEPYIGEMYLIGCRVVEAERDRDCSIEVKIEHPPETLRWLFNPTPKITITSQRDEDDPLFFRAIKLHTFITWNEKGYVFRKVFEEILWNSMLSLESTFILSQLLYIRRKVNVIPYMSIVMLVIQVLGYGLPLISNMKSPYNTREFVTAVYSLHGYERLLKVFKYTSKLLGLTAFLLTARILQKVYEYQSQIYPPGKKVFIFTMTIHVLSYLLLLFVNWTNLEVYASTVLDLFLLPQIIKNLFCQTSSKPLRKIYFIGLTLTRLMMHLYDFSRDPIVDSYTDVQGAEPRMINGSSISSISHFAVVVTMIGFAAVIYIQQNSNNKMKLWKSQ